MIQDVFAPNYSLSIFEGQGVRHPELGYGVVTHTPQHGIKKVTVSFQNGTLLTQCDSSELLPALMSESELENLRTKAYPLLDKEQGVCYDDAEQHEEDDEEVVD